MSELRAEGIDAGSVVLDVTSEASVRAAASQVADEYGRLDILVNNAGILPEATAGETPELLDLDLFRQTFDTNVFGAVTVTQEFLPLLRESESGRIVNVSTTIGSLSDWKTTAVRVLSTLARLDEGRAEVAGFDVAQVSPTSLRWSTADGSPPDRALKAARPPIDGTRRVSSWATPTLPWVATRGGPNEAAQDWSCEPGESDDGADLQAAGASSSRARVGRKRGVRGRSAKTPGLDEQEVCLGMRWRHPHPLGEAGVSIRDARSGEKEKPAAGHDRLLQLVRSEHGRRGRGHARIRAGAVAPPFA